MRNRSNLLRFSNLVNSISEITGKLTSFFSLFLVLVVSMDVFMRYLFNITFVSVQELEWHLYALIFLLGGAYTLRYNAHVRVDVIYQRLGKRGKAAINVLGCILFLFPGCYLVIKTSLPFMLDSWALKECSPNPGGLPARYLLKSMIPFSFAMIAIQGISLFLENIFILIYGKPMSNKR